MFRAVAHVAAAAFWPLHFFLTVNSELNAAMCAKLHANCNH